MKKIIVVTLFIAGAWFCLSQPASAQTIPNVRGLQPFTAQTNFMSMPGYLRWQYFVENNVWISRAEAVSLTRSQTGGGV